MSDETLTWFGDTWMGAAMRENFWMWPMMENFHFFGLSVLFGGLVAIDLKGPGEVTRVTIDDSLMVPGETEILADLIVAAHADAKRKLDEANGALMREAAGPMAGMNIPGMPKLF